MSALLKVDHLKILSLPAISFTLEKGQCLAIVGSSGVGKSLLLKSIADLVPPIGNIFFVGVERENIPATEWRKKIRYNPAETGWWAETVGAHFTVNAKKEIWLDDFGLQPEVMQQSVSTLSTGQKQRLGLLRALSDLPKILLLDEPTASLDVHNAGLVEKVLRRALSKGTAIVMVTHDLAQARRLADDIMTIHPDHIGMETI